VTLTANLKNPFFFLPALKLEQRKMTHIICKTFMSAAKKGNYDLEIHNNSAKQKKNPNSSQ
jgi:hypothetical protein